MTGGADVFNIREAAAFLGVHEQTIRRLARRGGIPAFKVGRDWRFRKDAILRWSEQQQPSPGPSSVLVIDDDERVCRALAKAVEALGCRARQAFDGRRGLELVAEAAPDLILLDLKMPEMNGPQFLAELRRTHPALPVVIVTAYPQSDLMLQASQLGPVMVMPKPVERALLERTVNVALGKRAAATVTATAAAPRDR